MKHRIPLRALVALALALLAACGEAQPVAELPTLPPQATPIPQPTVDRARLGPELRMFNWQDYIDPQVLADFQAEYGVRVTLETYQSNEELLVRLEENPGVYDLVVPGAFMADQLRERGMLAPLDRTAIPNLEHVGLVYQRTWSDPQGSYCAPYMWGPSGVAYNSDLVAEPTSWGALLNPVPALHGKVSLLDDQREVLGAALRYLGYSVNSASADELSRAQTLLAQNASHIRYTSDTDAIVDGLVSGELAIAHIWPGIALQAAARQPSIRYVIPREGTAMWQDCMAVTRDAPNPYAAHLFINFLNRPEVAARNATSLKYATTNTTAFPLLPPELKNSPALYPDPEVMLRLERVRPLGPVQQRYDRAWSELRQQR
ncbi:MAG TPA: spermidine/putrescine ABC transporter substrate-binding protein [Roseiflexaceae bacterium]|nr:spermidine/putrescine ABC transporter substrate-binding protein [Roseiflexaceae bacterium]